MAIVLDADALPAGERAEAIRDLIWSTVVRVEIDHHPEPGKIHAQGLIHQLGALNLCSVRSNATTVTRTSRLARDPDDAYIFLGMQLSGSSMVVQRGREALLRPGDMAVYDTRRPYTLVNARGIHQHFFRLPLHHLALHEKVVDAVTATRLDRARPLASVTAQHLRQLAAHGDRLTAREADAAAASAIGLVRALLVAQTSDTVAAHEYLDATLELRVLHYLRAHLHDPALSASRIAEAHHVSVRHLYRVLERSGVSLGDWLRHNRLEGARRALADPGESRTIAAIAHQWGFTDATHFGRAFKATYGVTPRRWRAAGRDGTEATPGDIWHTRQTSGRNEPILETGRAPTVG